MSFTVTPTGGAFGAVVRNIDLAKGLDPATLADLRQAWLEHHVLVFPDQHLPPEALIRFAGELGGIGDDPYIAPEPGLGPIAAIQRKATETGRVFADAWHADWTFKANPPAGTMLYGITIPPVGGDTLFADEHAALDAMPAELRGRIAGLYGLHSAKGAYATDGRYAAGAADRAMRIRTSDTARAVQRHPLIRNHPETGRPGLFAGSYVFAVEGMEKDASDALLREIADWITQPQFVYRHKWSANSLVLWDNRSVLHSATGGYDGHDRYLLRLTVR